MKGKNNIPMVLKITPEI